MPLYLPLATLALLAGVSLGYAVGGTEPAFALALVGLAMAGAWWLARRPHVGLLASLPVILVFGVLHSRAHVPRLTPIPAVATSTPCGLYGRVVEGGRPALPGARYTIRAFEAHCPGGTLPLDGRWIVLPPDDITPPLRGTTVYVHGQLRAPRPGLHPFAFQPDTYAARRGIRGTLVDAQRHIIIDDPRGLVVPLYRLRRAMDDALLRHASPAARGVLTAMVTGSRGELSSDTRDVFASTGVAHVLAVSGLHLGLIAWAVFTIARRLARRVPRLLRFRTDQQVAAGLTLPVIAAYVLLTGAPTSAIRAGLMAAVVLGTKLFDRPTSAPHALSAAILVMILVRPYWVMDLGFQLSVTATAGLVAHSHWLRSAERSSLPRGLRALRDSLRASLVATFATAPPLLWSFGSVPVLSPIANLVTVPPLALVALPLAFVGALLAGLGWPAGGALIVLASWVVEGALWVTERSASLLSLPLLWGRPSIAGLAGWTVAAVALTRALSGDPPWRTVTPWLGIAAILLALDLPASWRPPGTLTFTAIPVGQGDCTLITFPDGTRMLIDGGGAGYGDSRTGARAILPYLHAQGIGRVEILVSTHGDADHVKGIIEVIPELRPTAIWSGNLDPERRLDAWLLDAASAADIEVRVLHAEVSEVHVGDTVIEVLPVDHTVSGNDGSLMLRICHGDVCGLFPGDAEHPREAFLLSADVPLGAAYLKVGHHGSTTSSTPELLDAVRPQVALLHVGYQNHFDFPRPQTVERLDARGVHVARTDTGDAWVFETDGATWTFDVAPAWRWWRW